MGHNIIRRERERRFSCALLANIVFEIDNAKVRSVGQIHVRIPSLWDG